MIIVLIVLITKVYPCVSREETTSEEDTSEHQGVTPHLAHINEMQNLHELNDAQHRGPNWYDYMSTSLEASDIDHVGGSSSDSVTSSDSKISSESTSASSFETEEEKHYRRAWRVCSGCPHDMMKRYTNIGIKWICGGYQRARRSFKSPCMMRYRNCEDGTMFVKLYSGRCTNDTYHGKHWFYIYKT